MPWSWPAISVPTSYFRPVTIRSVLLVQHGISPSIVSICTQRDPWQNRPWSRQDQCSNVMTVSQWVFILFHLDFNFHYESHFKWVCDVLIMCTVYLFKLSNSLQDFMQHFTSYIHLREEVHNRINYKMYQHTVRQIFCCFHTNVQYLTVLMNFLRRKLIKQRKRMILDIYLCRMSVWVSANSMLNLGLHYTWIKSRLR